MGNTPYDDKFTKLFKLYYSDVYNFLLRLCRNSVGTNISSATFAEEMAQECFYRAYISLYSFRGECHIKSWLISIAKNVFYTSVRKKNINCVPFDEIAAALSDSAPIAKSIEDAQLINTAWDIINSMSQNMRDVMIYRICSDLSYKQIGLLMNISESSAKVLFFRSKQLLRSKLKEDYGYEL